MHLLCVPEHEARAIMEQVHEGECGPHMNGRPMAKKIVRQGYFWLTMEHDCVKYVRRCKQCQTFANLDHLPASELHNMTTPWPFSAWGIDVIGKIKPKSSQGHKYILVAIDYFIKWVEAKPFVTLGAKQVAQFISRDIICRYGMPHEIITDNGSHFQGEVIELLESTESHSSNIGRNLSIP